MQLKHQDEVVGSVVVCKRTESLEAMSENNSSTSLAQQGQQNTLDSAPPVGSSTQTNTSQPSSSSTYNPISSHQVGSSLGHSVVPDLMKVYESLTQSSTPQNAASQPQHPSNTVSVQQYNQPQHPPPQVQQQPQHSLPHPALQQSLPAPPQQHQQPQQYESNSYVQQQQYAQPQRPQPMYEPYAQPQQQPQPQPPQEHQPQHPSQQVEYFNQSSHSGTAYGQQQANNVYPPSTQEPTPPASDTDSTTDGKRSRKRSLDGDRKGRKKGSSDGRWSKRFTWPDDLHRDFVSAIFDVGLKHSSPSALLEFMPKHEQITSERIKSHLQKYRLHRSKSKKEFMTCYDSSIGKFQMGGLDNSVRSLSSGEVAAHLTYSCIMETDASNPVPAPDKSKDTSGRTTIAPQANEGGSVPQEAESSSTQQGGALHLPQLTEAEKHSPIGASMGYLMGLFFSLRQQLMKQREEKNAGPSAADSADGQPHIQHPGTIEASALSGAVSASMNPPHAMPANHSSEQQPHVRADTSVPWSTHATVHDQGQSQAFQETAHTLSSETPPADKTSAEQLIAHSSSSTRTNIEENNFMKREMQNQMAFQNKMRALKQQELNKYKNLGTAQTVQTEEMKATAMDDQTPEAENTKYEEDPKESSAAGNVGKSQAAGQTAQASNTGTKSRGLSFGNADEFWNAEAVDDHLFEFLMNS